MISYDEIKSKVKRWWDDGSFLQSSLKKIPFSKREVPKIGLDNIKNIHENAGAVFKSQDELIKNAKETKGYGYTIEWQEKNYKNIKFKRERRYFRQNNQKANFYKSFN